MLKYRSPRRALSTSRESALNRTVTRIVIHGLTALLAAAPLVWEPAFAEGPSTTSQQKMSDCAKANKGKKGDDYKSSVSSCLKGDSVAATPPTQQQKMATCSKANKGKKGDDYKTAMSECLKA